jgi:hypothetical protein
MSNTVKTMDKKTVDSYKVKATKKQVTMLSKNYTLVQALIDNKGFKRHLTSKQVTKESLKIWHEELNRLHDLLYTNIVTVFNDNEKKAHTSKIYNQLKKIYAIVDKVNGENLRSDAGVIPYLYGIAIDSKPVNSVTLNNLLAVKRIYVNKLNEVETLNGVNQSNKDYLASRISEIDEKIKSLKEIAYQSYIETVKTDSTKFYKLFEDFLAMMLDKQLLKTDKELQADLQARKQARKERRKLAKDLEKKVSKYSCKNVSVKLVTVNEIDGVKIENFIKAESFKPIVEKPQPKGNIANSVKSKSKTSKAKKEVAPATK